MKCVIIVDDSLEKGIAANTCAVLAMSLGKEKPELVGKDLTDTDGIIYKGITNIPLPVLSASQHEMKNIVKKSSDIISMLAIRFHEAAQKSSSYREYEERLNQNGGGKMMGLLLYGPRSDVKKFTSSLPLYC